MAQTESADRGGSVMIPCTLCGNNPASGYICIRKSWYLYQKIVVQSGEKTGDSVALHFRFGKGGGYNYSRPTVGMRLFRRRSPFKEC